MNLQQLEYIIAVDEQRHFVKAAEKCFVTQPTLSMMIQKLEDELETKIFDRSKQPIEPTPQGKEIIKRAREVLQQADQLKGYARDLKNDVSGVIRLGVIPTLAPYLLPLFIEDLVNKYPLLQITIKEMPTRSLMQSIKENQTDVGLLATPLNDPSLEEFPLYYEEFLAYSSSIDHYTDKSYILPSQIDIHELWLLEEGHCFRSQVLNFCELKNSDLYKNRLQYEAGSIETLINMVDKNNGITIVPLLATINFSPEQKKKLRTFTEPQPVREISLVVNKNFARQKILQTLKEEILKKIPLDVRKDNRKVVKLL